MRFDRRSLLLAPAAMGLLACSELHEQPTDWKTLGLQGKRLELQDRRLIEIDEFGPGRASGETVRFELSPS